MKRFRGLLILLSFAGVSACQSHPAVDHAPETSSTNAMGASGSPTQATAASTPLIARNDIRRAAAKFPTHFSKYAAEPLSNGELCVVGATTDEDGMDQRPVVYVAATKSSQPIWTHKLMLPANTFQSRATHCTSSSHSLFVLLQSDTQSEQTLSQTLLRVVKVDLATGTVQARQDIEVPGASSAWVDVGPSHFAWAGNSLIVSGNERLQSSPDQTKTFTLRMDADLKSSQGDQP